MLLAALCLAVLAQKAPLPPGYVSTPPELKLEFSKMGCHGAYAERFALPSPDPTDDIVALVRFKGTGGNWFVELDVRPMRGEHYQTDTQVVETTAFRPTAVCRRAGLTDILYVAGWDGPNGLPVVEEWTVGPLTISLDGEPSANGKQATLCSEPVITRRRLEIPPGITRHIRALACNPFASQLLVLEYGEPVRLHAWDLDTGTLETTLDAAEFPALEGRRYLTTGMTTRYGFYVGVRTSAKWHGVKDSSQEFIVLSDGDFDGRLESVQVISFEDWDRKHPSFAYITDYPAPELMADEPGR